MLQIPALSLPSRAPGGAGQVPGLGLAPALCLCLPEALLFSKAGYLRPGFGVFLSHNPFVAPLTACESAQACLQHWVPDFLVEQLTLSSHL